MVGMALVEFGTPEQQSRYLPGMAAGDMIAGFALTEPEAGSHAANMRTSIRRDGDDYIVSGSKSFVTNAPDADLIIVVGRMDDTAADDAGRGTHSALIVERESAGLTIGPARDKSCIRTFPRRGGKKSIPHESRLDYNCACLLYATDGLGNCLIAGPISGTNVGA